MSRFGEPPPARRDVFEPPRVHGGIRRLRLGRASAMSSSLHPRSKAIAVRPALGGLTKGDPETLADLFADDTPCAPPSMVTVLS
jgi:hypothetical protein